MGKTSDLDKLRAEMKVTRVPAEDPDDVRDRDEAGIDQLFYDDGRRVGDPRGQQATYPNGSGEEGQAVRRATRR